MDDNDLKDRIFKNPITTILGLIVCASAVYLGGGDKYSIAIGIASAIAGGLLKHPQRKKKNAAVNK